MIPVGAEAPDFELHNQHRETVRLSEFRGRRNVVMAFHPLAFTPICSNQVQTYEREKPALDALNAEVLAISTDAGPSKKAWAESLGGVSYHLLSDFHPQGKVSAEYGVMRDDGLSERALIVIDRNGIVRWGKVYPMSQQPDFHELLEAVRAV